VLDLVGVERDTQALLQRGDRRNRVLAAQGQAEVVQGVGMW